MSSTTVNYRSSSHKFYIPVMGTCFTIDAPLKVAPYGITSVIPLTDDVLIEQMRKFWCEQLNESYEPITAQNEDPRANRITAYLNFLQKQIDKKIAAFKATPFNHGSEITLYYEMLPDCQLKQTYQKMLLEQDQFKKQSLQDDLRRAIVAGHIDVNVMTKLDRYNYRHGQELPYEFCDAAASLRGFANSNLHSSMMVFSAGFNPHLYGYAATMADFFPDENNVLKKQICLKVSDFRSAVVQGKYLAKHGLWVSEYRVESPLNCGGHAFINDGQLMGPILEEFMGRRAELTDMLFGLYKKALKNLKKFCPNSSNDDLLREVRVTAQGGIGTQAEHQFLTDNYNLNAVGWGTPFLLVPEVIDIDNENLQSLIDAGSDDVYISPSSPLGVPFWNLRTSLSEQARRLRIVQNVPGSACMKGAARLNREFIETTKYPICVSSRAYQKIKLEELQNLDISLEEKERRKEAIVEKSCICHDLGGGATLRYGIDPKATPAICPGPNIVNFKKVMSLKEIIDHIYGRCSLLANKERPHAFIRELELQISYMVNELKGAARGWPVRTRDKLLEVKNNLSEGIKYYQCLVRAKGEAFKEQREVFLRRLTELQEELDEIFLGEVGSTSTTSS